MTLEQGKTYKVEIEDCCARGSFTSKLIKAEDDDGNDTKIMDYGTKLIFENGVMLINMSGVTLKDPEELEF
jgi:hypothetical protein